MSVEPEPRTGLRPPPRLGLLPMIIFGSRWLQLPLYLGLIVAQCVYIALFIKELWHLSWHALDLPSNICFLRMAATRSTSQVWRERSTAGAWSIGTRSC